jgi:hypothetical protein
MSYSVLKHIKKAQTVKLHAFLLSSIFQQTLHFTELLAAHGCAALDLGGDMIEASGANIRFLNLKDYKN